MVGEEGLEPSHLAVRAPKTRASANSAIPPAHNRRAQYTNADLAVALRHSCRPEGNLRCITRCVSAQFGGEIGVIASAFPRILGAWHRYDWLTGALVPVNRLASVLLRCDTRTL